MLLCSGLMPCRAQERRKGWSLSISFVSTSIYITTQSVQSVR